MKREQAQPVVTRITRRAALAAGALATLGRPAIHSAAAQTSGALSYWSMWSQGEPQQKVIQAALDAFSAETGVKVTTQWVGRNNLLRLAPTLNTANVPADLVDGAQRNVKSVLVSTGSQRDLTDVLHAPIPGEAGKTVASVVPAAYFESLTTSGKPWLVPYEMITSMWWYNQTNLPELAQAPPATWEAFVALLAARKAAGHEPLALDGDISNFNLYYFAEIAVRLLGPGGVRAAIADRTGAKLKDPRILQTAKLIEGLVRGGYFARGYDSGKWPAMEQRWATNRADLNYMGTWIVSEASAYAPPGFVYRAFPMPRPSAEAIDSVEVSFIGFAIPRKARNAAAAAQFISYFMNRARLAGIAGTALNLTARPDLEVPAGLADAKRAIDTAKRLHNQFDGMIDDYADYVTKILNPLNNELIFGKRSAEDFQTQLVAQSIQYWSMN